MKKILYLFCLGLLVWSCEKMNDTHDEYLKNGEIVYVGKVDSVIVYPGSERIVFDYWIGDPRVKTLKMYWANKKDSLTINVPEHEPEIPFTIQIGKNDKTITENTFTFEWVTWDDKGNRSIVFEKTATVYGPRYNERLNNRVISSVIAVGDSITLNWSASLNSQEIGLEMSYTNTSGQKVVETIDSEDIIVRTEVSGVIKESYVMKLRKVDLAQAVSYRTVYLPEPTAIDQFYAKKQNIELPPVNVALNKTATQSDFINSGGVDLVGNLLLDGITSGNTSRWVTDDSHKEHWVIIDLKGEYAVNGVKMWRDVSSNAAQLQPQFKVQADVGGNWVDLVSETNYTSAIYDKQFTATVTSKIRYYVPAYTNNRVRMFELAVYGKPAD